MSDGAVLTVKEMQLGKMSQPLSFELYPAQITMLTGPSGSGKSLVLKAVADLLAHSAKVKLQKPETVQQQNMPAPLWRRQVMYFAANSGWWAETIADHFESEPSEELLQSVGLSAELLKAHPEQCSSGEKQRLALLRGLQYEPQILLLDEITANLDNHTTKQIEQLLKNYIADESKHRAILWVSHDQPQCERLTNEKTVISLADYVGEKS